MMQEGKDAYKNKFQTKIEKKKPKEIVTYSQKK